MANDQGLAPFEWSWYSFSLPGYRYQPGAYTDGGHYSTYYRYPYDDIPPLPEHLLTGKLQWLVPLSRKVEKAMKPYRWHGPKREERIVRCTKTLFESAQALHLSLPDPFLQLMSSSELQDRIPSCTDCNFYFPYEVIRCPGSHDGYLIRFLDDQQLCLIWSLYLTPKNEHQILVSRYSSKITDLYSDDPDEVLDSERNLLNAEDTAEFVRNTYICAPSFENFLYRFWIENVLWFNLNLNQPMTEEQQNYLEYYKQKEVSK
jgi:hypothetical protein